MPSLLSTFIQLPLRLTASMVIGTGPGPLFSRTPKNATARLPYPVLRDRMLRLMADMPRTPACNRMTYKLEDAQSATELWELRGDLYDVLATEFMQAEATRRINDLIPCFEGWVPERQLKLVQ